MNISGKELIVNADVNDNGLKVELVDPNGNVLPGFGRDQSNLIYFNELRYRVAWTDGQTENSLEDALTSEPVAIRFVLENGDFYAFRVIACNLTDTDGYPVGDLNFDCRVNFVDFSILAIHWLECTLPECD